MADKAKQKRSAQTDRITITHKMMLNKNQQHHYQLSLATQLIILVMMMALMVTMTECLLNNTPRTKRIRLSLNKRIV